MIATPSPQFTIDRALQARRYCCGRSNCVFPIADFPCVIAQLENPKFVQSTLGGDWIKKDGWAACSGRGVESAVAGDGLPPYPASRRLPRVDRHERFVAPPPPPSRRETPPPRGISSDSKNNASTTYWMKLTNWSRRTASSFRRA